MRTRGPYDCSWILENIGSVFFYTCDFCILGFTTVQSLCCRIFVKYKGVILIKKKSEKIYNPRFPNTISAVLTA